ncbi:NERD domain-containing protein [Pasteurella canis]|uniref:NERD domain-containing protein n=1 Tax=Pasteurella canis TaxID=753 RepID=UPI001E50D0A8|nr:NERD domain-containing protein [Pasteurella canis]
MRSEKQIFNDLESLCQSPGYAHVIAYLCERNNYVHYSDALKVEHIQEQYDPERVIRSEISLLIGLMCKSFPLNLILPPPQILQEYIERTLVLLKELHQSVLSPIDVSLRNQEAFPDIFKSGQVLREAIFYSGESAYHFQYRDFSRLKYKKDNHWFIENKGCSVEQIITVFKAIEQFQLDKINYTFHEMRYKHPSKWTMLPGFIFSSEDIANLSNMEIAIVRNVIKAFTLSFDQAVSSFKEMDDFNLVNAYPIIPLEKNEYLLFQNYSLVSALYETPFFWFLNDKNYKNIAMTHRGEFTENFAYERLKLVFGRNNVFKNIDIRDNNNNKLGEIDVLVIFSSRAIILQAKAKKLTIQARKGNDLSLQEDFKHAVQDAYDQTILCGELLLNEKTKLILSSGNELQINRDFVEIYPICLIAEHYPALAMQVRQFLQQNISHIMKPAFVIDIFCLDVLAEMLSSPLYFLSYLNRRVLYFDKVYSSHELTILSYHLKYNLWFNEENQFIHLGDDIGAELDLVMLSRREGISKHDILDGILTRFKETFFHQLLYYIETSEKSEMFDLGLMLLTLNENSIHLINHSVKLIQEQGKQDRKHHDFTLVVRDNEGLTIHCNNDPFPIALERLIRHCEWRKYLHKSSRWFGLCIDINNANIRFSINKNSA